MHIKLNGNGCTLYRDPGDARISHESTVTHHMRRLLRLAGHNVVRLYPNRVGLTSCRQGLIEHKTGLVLWHERYAIENAATEFNHGAVLYMKATQ